MRSPAFVLCTLLLGVAMANAHAAEAAHDSLARGFLQPPPEARPLVFWQWVNGNVSQQGIRLDLEWMQRVGIGGALMFDVGFNRPPVPQYVKQRVGFGTSAWREAVRFSAAEARRLGLLLGAQSSGGWSVSGGPSVAADQAMKKLVWSESILTHDSPRALRLPPPPASSGPYQDLPIDNEQFRQPTLSREIAVIGFRLPESEQAAFASPVLSGVRDAELLQDQAHGRAVEIVADAQGNAAIEARMDFAPRAVTLGAAGRGGLPAGFIEASSDGVEYRRVIELPGAAAQPSPVVTFALGQRRERLWRIRFTGLTRPVAITEARFEPGTRLDRAQEKAGFGVLTNYTESATAPAGAVIEPRSIVDLTSKMSADGTLRWRPGEGRWMVLRFGWSLTGRRTVPATPESIGLEVDKLDAAAVRSFADAFFDQYGGAIGNDGALGIAFTDSWEAGQQTWTPMLLEQFAARRGYDLRAWLPVLTGRIVGDVARSEKVLADFRRTIADLLAENHYGVLAEAAHRRGMQFYAEAAGTDRPTVIDGLQAKGRVDVPTGEFWYWPEGAAPKPNHVADVREATSAAHIYGKRFVAAESLTSQGEEPWALGPAQLRRMMDRFFAEGVNRVILHTSAHQPFVDQRPGMTLRQYGQHFTRNETWAEDAGAWIDYLARTSWMLQQGQPVADIAVYVDAQATEPWRLAGFSHDYVNTEVLLNRLNVRDGRLVLPDGISYSMLLIAPNVRRMSLPAIRKLQTLIRGGALVIGPRPLGAVGLADDEPVLSIANELWGAGKIAPDLEYALQEKGLAPDVSIDGQHDLHWTHRASQDADIYFISNQSAQPFEGSVKFRVTGRDARIWDAADGSRSPVSYAIDKLTTTVRLKLAPYGSRFVVFRGEPAAGGERQVAEPDRVVLQQLADSWDVEFLELAAGPRRMKLPASMSWTQHADPDIRYYSGRARYSRTLAVPVPWLESGRIIELDLGTVAEMAHVRINGQDLGVWWNPPFRRDITRALRAGRNQLEIVVTNYWVNRLVGDEQPGVARRTFAPIKPYDANSPLRPSGLLGPVRLLGGAGLR